MRTPILAVAGGVMLLAVMPAAAQDDERYQLERTERGYVRLDTRTGAMSLCTERDGRLVCRIASEEEAAGKGETSALAERVEALESRLAALEAGRSRPLPSAEEFEQSLGYMERFFRRFFGIVREFDEERSGGPPPLPEPPRAPDRT